MFAKITLVILYLILENYLPFRNLRSHRNLVVVQILFK